MTQSLKQASKARQIACSTALIFSSFSLPAAQFERISVASSGGEANAESFTSRISANGRYVAFSSAASNLVVNDTNKAIDIFVRATNYARFSEFCKFLNRLIVGLILSITLATAEAATANFTLSEWAHGLSGDYDEVYLTSSGTPLSDEARTGGSDSYLDLSFRKGTRSHETFSSGLVSAKELRMHSYSGADASADVGFGTYGTGTIITQGRVSASVPFRVNSPTLNGQAGVMQVPIFITGSLGLSAGFSTNYPGHASGEAEVLFDVSGNVLNPQSGCVGFVRCQKIGDIGGSVATSGRPIDGTVFVELPFYFGQWTSYSMQLQTRAGANATAIANNLAPDRADVGFRANSPFFGYEVKWGGISAILNDQGLPVTAAWTVESLPGVDLVAPVPLPSSGIFMLLGLITVSWLKRQSQPVRCITSTQSSLLCRVTVPI